MEIFDIKLIRKIDTFKCILGVQGCNSPCVIILKSNVSAGQELMICFLIKQNKNLYIVLKYNKNLLMVLQSFRYHFPRIAQLAD